MNSKTLIFNKNSQIKKGKIKKNSKLISILKLILISIILVFLLSSNNYCNFSVKLINAHYSIFNQETNAQTNYLKIGTAFAK